jgi:hypothetical protein
MKKGIKSTNPNLILNLKIVLTSFSLIKYYVLFFHLLRYFCPYLFAKLNKLLKRLNVIRFLIPQN